MRLFLLITSVVVMLSGAGACEEALRKDPMQGFFQGNAYYEERDYAKAIQGYESVLKTGLESGNLYYNMGNAYFKAGDTGRAILYYHRARRLIPHDSDLKSNLEYARSFVDDGGVAAEPHRLIARLVAKPFRELNLNAIAISAAFFYLVAMMLLTAGLIWPGFARRGRVAMVLVVSLLTLNVAGFGLRYYGEMVVRHGIIVSKEAEAKYEPIDNSVTYYVLRDGSTVVILKTRGDWSQVKRADGKMGWVKKDAVEGV